MQRTNLTYGLPLYSLCIMDINGNRYFAEQLVTAAKAVSDNAVGEET